MLGHLPAKAPAVRVGQAICSVFVSGRRRWLWPNNGHELLAQVNPVTIRKVAKYELKLCGKELCYIFPPAAKRGRSHWGFIMRFFSLFLTTSFALIPGVALAQGGLVPAPTQQLPMPRTSPTPALEPIAAPVVQPQQPLAHAVPLIQTENAVLRAGTPVALKMMELVTTKEKAAKVGQRIQLEVAAPVEINGVTVIAAGTPAWGELTHVRNKGMWGKSGQLEARLLYLRVNGRQIRMSGSFDDKGVAGTAGVVGAIALVPVAGFFITGTSAEFPLGGAVNGFIDEDVVLAFKQSAPAPLEVAVTQAPMTVDVPAVIDPSQAD